MKHLFIIFAFILALSSKAQDTIKVLFIGNSYTYVENMPDLFRHIADSAGYKVKTQMFAPGGVSVGDISQGTQAHMNNPLVYENIRSDKWDYVVLQDNQGRFVLDYGQFPSSSLVIQGHLQIRDSVLKNNPCAKMIWFAGWGVKNGYPPYGNTGIEMINRIAANYQFLNDTAHQIIAPIGGAWKKIILTNPSFDLFSSDEMHPSLEGAFLTANVIYSTIFRDNPKYSSANGGLPPATVNLLKQAGWQTVIDSLQNSNLQSITPDLLWQNNQLTAGNYQHYYWYKDMQWQQSISGNIFNINLNAHYYLMAENSNGCLLKSFSQHLLLLNTDDIANEHAVNFYPNPTKDFITLNINVSGKSNAELKIYNLYGDLLKSEMIEKNQQQINIKDLSNGIYLVVITSDDVAKSFKLIVQR